MCYSFHLLLSAVAAVAVHSSKAKMGHNWHSVTTTTTTTGEYSKRRRSNVAVIIVGIVFISSFLFYCLLLNHSFPTNPNKITNCFQLVLFYLQLYNFNCSCFPAILIFEHRYLLRLPVRKNMRSPVTTCFF